MRRSTADGDSETAGRLARVVGLPPDPDPYPWDESFPPAGSPDPGPDSTGGRSWLSAVDPGRRGVRALIVVAALVGCVAAFLAWRSRPQVTPAPPVASVSALPPAAVSSPPARLIVSVVGKVQRPGLVDLPPGARVADAIAGAGGMLPGAEPTGLNLARKVVDGEMIAVGIPAPPGAAPPVAGGGSGGGLVNLNTATVAELQTLPGIGQVLAQRIIDHRDRHGGFRAVTDLRQVEGIGDAKFAQLKDRVTV
ncbi:helix-hairpin-helix domain-containing protein [Dactylosporangium sp. NPDC000521]|uniref:helix-hairpin-helix domain-containing protein n=1 Tax=Dactylosporangium sp. NPDC000521 TaxID=3363975 RepID=UPI003690BD7E